VLPTVGLRPCPRRVLLQSLLAAGCIGAIMLALDTLLHAAIVSSLGATTFIVFALPHSQSAQPRSVLCGYAAGAVAGILLWLAFRFIQPKLLAAAVRGWQIGLGAVAVGTAMLLMVWTHHPHPPAAGLALGMVMGKWTVTTLAFTALAIILLCGLRQCLRRWLVDLV